jgi:hypothetical protein
MLFKKTRKFILSVGLLTILVLLANNVSYAQDSPPAGDNGCAHVVPPEDNDSGGTGSNNPQDDGINGPSCKEDRTKDDDGEPGGGGDTTPTPEPVTMLLFGAGLAGVGYARRRFKKDENESEAGE